MKKVTTVLLMMSFMTSCTKECKPLRCKITQWDYQVCWSPDNSHQYVIFDDPEVQYIDTDECEWNTSLKPLFLNSDTVGISRFTVEAQKQILNKPTVCDCY
jgi:hypothetical protein